MQCTPYHYVWCHQQPLPKTKYIDRVYIKVIDSRIQDGMEEMNMNHALKVIIVMYDTLVWLLCIQKKAWSQLGLHD